MQYPNDTKMFKRTCANNFVNWFMTNPPDVGGQCRKGIIEIMHGKYIDVDNKALGNGSLMRALPCAILGNLPYNIHQGMLTHNNQKCHEIIQDYSRLIQDELNGIPYTNIQKLILEPSGYIRNTFNNAVMWAQEGTFKQAILSAVNHGGDADTIAAITGSIAGVRYGFDSIPKRWIKQLNPEVKKSLNIFIKFANTYVQ